MPPTPTASVSLCECGCGQRAPVARWNKTRYGWVAGQPMRFVHGHRSRLQQPGCKRSPETLRKISEAMKGKLANEKHPNWRGDDVSYGGLHKWLERNKPRALTCEACGDTPWRTHFANLSGKYRRDLADYAELCPKCHKAYDGGRLSINGGEWTWAFS